MMDDIAVWSLYPDWSDGLTETLEFLTSVASSPLVVEQRRGLRLTPRQYFEYSYVLEGPWRTYFDLLTMQSAGSPLYLPIWHDSEVIKFPLAAGDIGIAISTQYTEFRNCRFALVGGRDPFNYEVVEIQSMSDTVIVLENPLVGAWPVGTRVVPLKKCKVDQQASTTHKTATVMVARVKFCSIEANRADVYNPFNIFLNQFVLEEDPDETEDLTYAYERAMSVLDNTMGLPSLYDVTGQIVQQFRWYARERVRQHRLRSLFYTLDGRRLPIWVPTVYSDFDPRSISPLAIDVKRCGFTDTGGPRPQREYILIYLKGGTRLYRRITDSVILGDGEYERLFIDEALDPLPVPAQVFRISFLVLSRLDTDTLEITHHTNTRGVTTAVAVFRSATGYPGIGLETDIEVPPTVVSLCVHDFQWWYATTPINGDYALAAAKTPPRGLDKYGNAYHGGPGNTLDVFGPGGAKIYTLTRDILDAKIDAWYGSPIVFDVGSTESGFMASPIYRGNYVLAYVQHTISGSGFSRWWVLLEPSASGDMTVVGAVWYGTGVVFPPYVNGINVLGAVSEDAAILVQAYANIGSYDCMLIVLPSIAAFLAGTYADGYPGLPAPRVRTTLLSPISSTAFSHYLFVQVPTNQSKNFGFLLPGSSGNTLLYIYINRSYMDYTATSSFVPPDIKDSLRLVYPNGCILKINLHDLDYEEITTTALGSVFGHATDAYTIDNANWRSASGEALIPFLDEYTYISDGSIGGKDCYSLQVAATQLRDNGHYWVVYYMPGRDDAVHRAGSVDSSAGPPFESPIYARIRVFDYDPTTEVAVQVYEQTCILHTDEDIAQTFWVLSNDYYINATISEVDGIATVVLHGPVFKTTFCKFSVPE